MQPEEDPYNSFREKLEKAYQWPALYTFKFIAPAHKIEEVKALFPRHEINEKASSKGKYHSLTINIMARSSEEIITYYIEVHKIGEILSL